MASAPDDIELRGAGLAASARFYRRDIDGLRAVAVLPILLFHAGSAVFSGGFVGVDVFFVISGFLITGIIWSEIREHRFSIVRFYERRIRRIFPALIVVLVATLLASAFLFLPRDFATVPKSALAALGFCSNVLFWSQTDYFDAPSKLKPLLHTWSLAVEEQYYLFFPVLMIVLYRLNRRWIIPAVWTLAILSFAAAVFAVSRAPSLAFYMIPTRMWELLTGSLLALGAVRPVRQRLARDGLAALGLGLILLAVFAYSETTPFPGLAATLPVLGSALLIHCGQDTRVGALLSTRVMVFVGLISYSLYLWHWPVAVFVAYWRTGAPGAADIAFIVAVSLVLATLSWHYLERPFRRPKSDPRHLSQRAIFQSAAVASVIVVALAALAMSRGGFDILFPPTAQRLAAAADDISPRREACHRRGPGMPLAASCTYGTGQPGVALWGDSHGVELAYAVGEQLPPGTALRQYTYSSCLPAVGVRQRPPGCDAFNRAVYAELSRDPAVRTVIWVAFLDAEARSDAARLRAIQKTIAGLAAAGKQVIIVYPIPRQPDLVPSTLAKWMVLGRDPASFGVPTRTYLQRNAAVLAALDAIRGPGIDRVIPAQSMCDRGLCRAIRSGHPLYFDAHHLSLTGARLLAPQIDALVMPASAGGGPSVSR